MIATSRILHLLTTILLLQATVNHGLTTGSARIDGMKTASENHRHRRHHHQYSPKESRYDNVKLWEGDILPDYSQMLECFGANTTDELVAKGILSVPENDNNTNHNNAKTTQTTTSLGFRLWPYRIDDVTVIPYEFAKGAFSDTEQSIIEKTMRDLARQVSVIQFAPRRRTISSNNSKKKEEANHLSPYLRFTADKIHIDYVSSFAKDFTFPCWTEHVGWNGGSHQAINLGEDFCIAPGPVMHLLLHTLGSWEPTSRWDRDEYVTIVWENVLPGLEFNLHKRIHNDTLGFPYFDYDSIMNNFNDDYSKNGNDTILSPKPIGQLDHLSAGDVLWVRLLYQCRFGPRVYGDFLSHPCTEDCPCWQQQDDDKSISSSTGGKDDNKNGGTAMDEVAMSCDGNDAACRGNLVCSPQMDRCVRRRSDNKIAAAETVTMWWSTQQVALTVVPFKRVMNGGTALVLVTIACFGAVLLLSLVRAARRGVHGAGLIARRYRRDYETIP